MMTDAPIPSPEAALWVANNHQEQYELLAGRRHTPLGLSSRERNDRLHHGIMVENNALLAIAGFLQRIDQRLEQLTEVLPVEVTVSAPPPMPQDIRVQKRGGPHSRACGIRVHEHGPKCHSNCPTCGGKALKD